MQNDKKEGVKLICQNCENDNLVDGSKVINLGTEVYCTECLWYDEERKELRLYKYYH